MTNYLDWKRQLQKNDGFDPITIDKLPYYEYLHYQRGLEKDIKEKIKQQKDQANQQKSSGFKMPKMNFGKYFK